MSTCTSNLTVSSSSGTFLFGFAQLPYPSCTHGQFTPSLKYPVRTAAPAHLKNYHRSKISGSVSVPADTLETHTPSRFGVTAVDFGTNDFCFLSILEGARGTPLKTPPMPGALRGSCTLRCTSTAAFSTPTPEDQHQTIQRKGDILRVSLRCCHLSSRVSSISAEGY